MDFMLGLVLVLRAFLCLIYYVAFIHRSQSVFQRRVNNTLILEMVKLHKKDVACLRFYRRVVVEPGIEFKPPYSLSSSVSLQWIMIPLSSYFHGRSSKWFAYVNQ